MSNNEILVKAVIHVVVATLLAYVATQFMGDIGIPHVVDTITLHGYTFDLAALVLSHLVVAKVFFGGE